MPARPTPRTPRRQSRVSVTRKKILRAAERGFSSTGYEATSLTDVAEASGVAVGSVYYHFRDKHTLLLALMDDLFKRLSHVRPNALPLEAFLGATPRSDIEQWVRRSYEMLKKRPSIYLVLLGLAESDPELRERRLRLDQLAIEQLTHMITLGEESGRFRRDGDAAASAFMIHHSIEMTVTQLLVRGSGVSDTNAILGSLSKMICRYLLEDEPIQPADALANGEGSP
jgi:AcrR family transcriptional regulator